MTAVLHQLDYEPVRESEHLPALDGLRGVAILLVMVFHFLPFDEPPTSRVGGFLFFLASCGWCGVDLFFVLSGFLITRILLAHKGDPRFFRNFYGRRTLRIFPLYYFVLILCFVVLPIIRPSMFSSPDMIALQHRQGWLWAYAVNIPMAWYNDLELFRGGLLFFAPFWSLAVEEHFYLIWPTITYLFDRRGLYWVCGLGMIVSLLLRIWLFHRQNAWAIYISTPTRVDTLMLGAAIAVLMRGSRAWIPRFATLIHWLPWPLGVAWLLINWHDPIRDYLLAISIGYNLTSLFFASILLRCVIHPTHSPVLNTKILRIFGKYSYGLYVYHTLLGPIFEQKISHARLQDMFSRHLHITSGAYTFGVFSHILIAGAISFLIAWLSWQLMEKPILKLKRYFEYQSRATT